MSTHAAWDPNFAGAEATFQTMLRVLQGEEVADSEIEVVLSSASRPPQDGTFTVSSKHAGQSSILRRTGATVTSGPSNGKGDPPTSERTTSWRKPLSSVHYQDSRVRSHRTSEGEAASWEVPSSQDRPWKTPSLVGSATPGLGASGLKGKEPPSQPVMHKAASRQGLPAGGHIVPPVSMDVQNPTPKTTTDMVVAAHEQTMRPVDLESLRSRLTSILKHEQDNQSMSLSEQTAARLTGGSPSSRTRRQSRLTAEPMTALTTARTDVSDGFFQDRAVGIVDDIVQTCADLEQALATTKIDSKTVSSSSAGSRLPSARWSAQAAEAAMASARAAEAAANHAATASALAAKEAARAAAAARAAIGRYDDLVDWLCTSPRQAAQLALEAGSPAEKPAVAGDSAAAARRPKVAEAAESDESSDDDPNEGISQHALTHTEEVIKMPEFSLDELIGPKVWTLLVQELDLDPVEGGAVIDSIRTAASASHRAAHEYPLREFLEALHIEEDDAEGLQVFVAALEKAKRMVSAGHEAKRPTSENRSAHRTLFDKVLRHLATSRSAVGQAWKLVSQGEVQVSEAEEALFKEVWRSREAEFIKRVQHYLVEPPVLNATAGQVVCQQRCNADVARVIQHHKSTGEKFYDEDWDITKMPEIVLYVDKQKPGWDCTVAHPVTCKRLPDFVKEANEQKLGSLGSLFGGMARQAKKRPTSADMPKVFKDGIGAGDIVQGQLGTCFLLGAIGALAGHNPKAIRRLFISYDVEAGVYGVRFNSNGDWTYVVIDDWFPVDDTGELLYSRCRDPQEVWVPLLEKAFCKLYTCYEMCDGGRASEAVASFFGGVSGHLTIKRAHRKRPERFFRLLKQARDRGWLLTTSFREGGEKRVESSGKCGEGILSNGLVAGHAYAVLRVVEAEEHQLICCLNPWGNGEWTGKWSDKNAFGEWTASMRKALNYHKADDGKFWMSVQDFVRFSAGVDYARTFGPNWQKISHYKHFSEKKMLAVAKRTFNPSKRDELRFSKGDKIEVMQCTTEWWRGNVLGSTLQGFFRATMVEVKDKPVMRFDLIGTVDKQHESMKVVLMLMQPNSCMFRRYYTRPEDGLNYKDTSYGHLQFIVVGPDDRVAFKREGAQRCVWGELELPGGGHWKVYALSVDGKGGQCTVRAYLKHGTAILKEVAGATFAEVKSYIVG